MILRDSRSGAYRYSSRRVSTILTLFLASIVFGRPSIAVEAVPGSSARSSQTEVQVLISALDGTGAASVALIYPRVVQTPQVQADLDSIARSTHWQVQNPRITTNSNPTPDRPSMTSADFQAASAVPEAMGSLPVEQIVIGLKKYRFISIVFGMRPNFQFRGLQDYRNKYISVAFRPAGQAYTYDVEIVDPNFERLNLPTIVQAEQPKQNGQTAGSRGILAAFLISVAVGGVVWLIAHTARVRRPA